MPRADLYPIERGIQVPKIKHRKQYSAKYPWEKLECCSQDGSPDDESFLVPCHELDLASTMNSLTSCRNWMQKKTGKKFVLRSTNQGVRVWRVE